MKTNKTRFLLAIAAAGTFATGLLRANPSLLYEGFDYADGGGFDWIRNEAGGNGFAGAWNETKNPSAEAIAPGLTFGDLETVGSCAKSASTLWGHMTRATGSTLADAGLLDDGSTLWFSVIFDNSVATVGTKNGVALGNGGFSTSSQEDMAGGVEGIGIIQSNFGAVEASYWAPGKTSESTGVGLGSDPVLLVGKIEWGATSGEGETLTVFTPDTSLNRGEAKAILAVPAVDQSTFDSVAVLTKNDGKIDEIRFGATYEEVVSLPPLPSSTEPRITSIRSVGGDLWELTLKGNPASGYVFQESAMLEFAPGSLVENLVPGVSAVGTIGGINDSEITTDGSGNATVRMMLSGSADFVRALRKPE